MSDPNVYQGSGKGGTQVSAVNLVAAFGVDNTGATDCGPTLSAALAVMAASGQRCSQLPSGLYQINTPVVVPSKTILRGAGIGKTILQSGIAGGPALNNMLLGRTVYGATGTVAAPVVVGSRTFTSTTVIVPFAWCLLTSALPTTTLHTATYQVIKKTGAGPTFTYTVDRAILRPFTTGDTLTLITTILEGVEMSDFTATGTGTRALNFIGAVHTRIHDLVIDGSGGVGYFGEGGSFDDAGYDNEWRRVTVVGDSSPAGLVTSNHGVMHESGEAARTVDCITSGCFTSGQTMWDCYNSETRDPISSLCGDGVYLGGDNALTVGSNNCRIIGGACDSNLQDYSIGNSSGCSILNPGSANSQVAGVLVEGTNTTTGRAFDVSITGGYILNANSTAKTLTGGGIAVINCAGIAINGVAIEAPFVAGITFSGTAISGVSGNVGTIRNVQTAGINCGIFQFATGATGKIVGVTIDGAGFGIFYDGGSFSRFVLDAWGAYNLASGRVATGQQGIVDGVIFKADGATTQDVTDVRTVICNDTNPTTVTNPMVNGYSGQTVDYVALNGNTTVNRGTSYLAGGANWVSTSVQAGAATLGLIYQGSLAAAIERYRVNTNA